MANPSLFFCERPYTISFRKLIYYIFLFFVFFPYLQVIPTGTDMQPFALISAMLLFFAFKIKLYMFEVWLFYMLVTAFLLLFFGNVNFIGVRSFVNYASLFFISYVSFRVLKSGRVNLESFLLITFSVWFLVALLQKFFKSDFLTFLVSASRTTEDRGVTGLAPEPTFLGIVFLFYIIISLHLPKFKFRSLLIFFSVFGILILAKSSMVVLFLMLMLIVFIITHVGFKSLALLCFSSFSLFFVLSFLEGSRIQKLVDVFTRDPHSLLLIDASINDRFFHVYFSLKGFIENFLVPNGYYSWVPYAKEQLILYQDIVMVEWFSLTGRIMSGYGGSLFELGMFFLIVPFLLTYNLFRFYKMDFKSFLFFSIYVNMIMFSAIPIGFPIFAFYFGLLAFLAYKKDRTVM
ncbi:hypothetical protein VCSRO171_2786 [Vibrio cholerae]|nr:putative O-antigen polymerase [Vibrio cholerae]BCN18779.1 putative O-antigen polymerase [Vibrio cholerae]GHY43007.1 hypothetical protein VCSRO165_2899 [Vibrio cholerae]GHZ12786.1 hypothetical protein VCSRO171_2786 [Vibrio cholerae]